MRAPPLWVPMVVDHKFLLFKNATRFELNLTIRGGELVQGSRLESLQLGREGVVCDVVQVGRVGQKLGYALVN